MKSKMDDLRSLSEDELQNNYKELSKEIFELTSELKTMRKLDKPHLLKERKKQRARVLTAWSEKKGGNE